jgi:non-specific serine/threonine protein kinase/serine/threonine-protein kinase
VYSLGAVLYVLLTGFLPFETKDWRKQRFDEFLRRLREEDPPRPSTKIGMEKETSRPTAEARGAEPKHLVSLLRGDLDWITLKALEKDRARRYGTPSELAVDISRYLNNEPVVARPASTAYRVRKYVQRHKLGVSAVTAMALLLVSFAVVQAIQVRRVTQERDRVTRERDRADRVTDFITNMFKVSDPSEARGNSITAREILDKASKEIDTGLAKDQVVQAQMMHVMGNVYANLGVYPRAQSLLEQAAKIRTRELGAEHTDTLASARELAWTLRQAGHYAEAEKLLRPTLEAQRRILGPDHPYTLESMLMMGNVERNLGNLSQAQPVLEEALNRRRRKLGPEHPDTLVAANELGYVLAQQGHYAEAEKLLRQTLETQRRVLGPDHPNTFDTMGRLSVLLGSEAEQGHREHFAEAEALGRETVEISRRVLGPDHRFTLTWQYHLASTLQDEKQYANAEKLLRETFEAQRGVLGPEHPDTLASMDGLALSLMYRGHYREAERLERQLLETWRRILGPESSEAADSIYELGFLAAYQGNRDRAFSLLREAVDHGAPPWLDLGIEEDENLKSLHGDPVSTPWLPQRARRCSAKEAVRDNLEDPILE